MGSLRAEPGGSRNSDDRPISERTGSEVTSGGVAFAFPVVAASYFRTRESRLEPATAGAPPGRENEGTARVGRSLLLHQFGLSLAHSLGDAVVLGATVRVMRGELSTLNPAERPSGRCVRRARRRSHGPSRTQADVDRGCARACVAPAPGTRDPEPDDALVPGASDGNATGSSSDRRGSAWPSCPTPAAPDGRTGWSRSTPTSVARIRRVGERRDVAWVANAGSRRTGLAFARGVSASTAGEARPALSGGASVAVASGFWVEARVTRGGDDAARGWGLVCPRDVLSIPPCPSASANCS